MMYHPLKDGQIRLLSISDEVGLVFQLEVVELMDPPPYIALSYTWGKASYRKGRPDSQRYPIYLDGQQIHVDQNLHDALRQLCPKIREGEFYLWIDRVCINQADLGERSAQVRLMKQIYEQATIIYGWLGQPFDENETRLAVELMDEFRFRLADSRKKNGGKDYAAAAAYRLTIDDTHDLFPRKRGTNLWIAWDGICEMMNQAYWGRMWIYQEATTPGGHDKVIFFCGQHHFNHQRLQAVCFFGSVFSTFPDFDRRFVDAIGPSAAPQRLVAAITARANGKSSNLADLLLGMKGASCTDPRDRIYAPLAQAADVGPDDIRVDYTRSLTDVYVEVAKFLHVSYRLRPLETLGYCYTPAPDAKRMMFSQIQDPTLPSWVPDWRHRVLLQRFSDSSRLVIGADTLYDPLPNTKVEAEIENLSLSVKGFLVTELNIQWLGDIWDGHETAQETPRRWCKMIIDEHGSESILDDTICRSLVGDCRRTSYEDETGNYVIEWKRGRSFDWDLFARSHSTLNPEETQLKMSDDMVLDAMCFGRRLALLTGDRVAILPAAAKLGDEIAAFSGGKTLYLLRRAPEVLNTFSFIGECYVDGLMDGQLLKNSKNDVLDMDWLRLI